MSAISAATAFTLSDVEFHALRELVHELTGIKLSEGKTELVKRRFGPRLRALELASFTSYISYVKDGHADELSHFADAITTNLTSFFREDHHFDYLKDHLPDLLKSKKDRRVRAWSAGCSTGQEIYTLAMTLLETVPGLKGWDMKLLATDLDGKCLEKASAGIYSASDLEKVPGDLVAKWFDQVQADRFKVSDKLRDLISFKRLNFIHHWPMKGPFDVIFCRNVFIYFNREMQQRCLGKFAQMQRPGDLLFLGHSESIGEREDVYRLLHHTTYERR